MRFSLLTLASAIAMSALSLSAIADDGHKGHRGFTLTSPDLASGTFSNKFVLNGFGCSGANVSPELRWSNVPPGTQSLALQVYDPDAPTGSGFWHWAVYNIPATATGLAQGAGNSPATLPPGAYGGNTDFMDTGATGVNGNYGGPCPPVGDKPHHYTFTLFALAVPSAQAAGGIPPTGSAALYGFVINKGLGAALLGQASFTARYGR
ncbi:MAG: YbhB/YbcL family Raf kinase inhibitor-like protein [Burkholderiaceae bacterium]